MRNKEYSKWKYLGYKLLFVFSTLIFTNGLHAQSTLSSEKEFELKYRNALKITPMRWLTPVHPGFELAYERFWNSSFSTQMVGTWLFHRSLSNVIRDEDYQVRGYRLAFEPRYYYKVKEKTRYFVGFDFNYFRNTSQGTQDIRAWNETPDGNIMIISYENTYGIEKQMLSFIFKIGFLQIFESKRFTFDFFAGLGPKYVDTVLKGNLPFDEDHWRKEGILNSLFNKSGKYWSFALPSQIRVVYLF